MGTRGERKGGRLRGNRRDSRPEGVVLDVLHVERAVVVQQWRERAWKSVAQATRPPSASRARSLVPRVRSQHTEMRVDAHGEKAHLKVELGRDKAALQQRDGLQQVASGPCVDQNQKHSPGREQEQWRMSGWHRVSYRCERRGRRARVRPTTKSRRRADVRSVRGLSLKTQTKGSTPSC